MFRVLHDNEVILEIEEQVLSATIRTARGSGMPVFLSEGDGVIELAIEKVPTGGPVRLDQLEAAQVLETQERLQEGEQTHVNTGKGVPRDQIRKMLTHQGKHFDTLGPGASDKNERPSLRAFPQKDLAEGAETPEERTKAIQDWESGREPSDTEGSDEADDDESRTDNTKSQQANDTVTL